LKDISAGFNYVSLHCGFTRTL